MTNDLQVIFVWKLDIRIWSFPVVVALRIELSATRVSDGFGQPALDYLVTIFATACGLVPAHCGTG